MSESEPEIERRHDLAKRVADIDVRLANVEEAVRENTEITKDIRDAVVAGRVAAKLIKWLGAIAAAGSAIWIAWYQLTHGGKMPHQ